MQLFELGTVDITPRAADALAAAAVDPADLLARHQRGDWGDIDEENRSDNTFALEHPQAIYPLVSCYRLAPESELVVITATDRSCTRVLLADEEQVREVSTLEGYAVWAAAYDHEPNPLVAAEGPLVDDLLADLPVTAALDVGAGTGRYVLKLARRGVTATAIDQSPEMLAVARRAASEAGVTVDFHQGTVDDGLPFAAGRFDLVICALVLCHVPDVRGALHELARVLRPGGHLLITDFHPDAVGAGWRTTFERPGTAYLLPNPGHTRADYLDGITAAGCSLLKEIDILIRDVPAGYFSEGMIRDLGDKPFGFVVLGQKDAGSNEG